MKPIIVITHRGDCFKSDDCLPVIQGILATGARLIWQEQLVRVHEDGTKKVITPFYNDKGEVVTTIMVG